MKPLRDNIILEQILEEKTSSGIILPISAQDRENKAAVVDIGPGVYNKKKNKVVRIEGIEIGDTIIYYPYNVVEFEEDGKKYVIINKKDVIARI